MENKEQRPLFLGFSSQKGGVGKSTLAEIVSSILYYEQGINLFVMDCDLSQDSFYKLREREKSIVQESEELSKSMQEYFHHLGKKHTEFTSPHPGKPSGLHEVKSTVSATRSTSWLYLISRDMPEQPN